MSVHWSESFSLRNVTVINGVSSLELLSAAIVAPSDVFVRGGRFASEAVVGAQEVDCTGLYLIPGLIDLQLNDMHHMDHCARETVTEEEHRQRFAAIAHSMVREGVTSFVLATIAMPWDALLQYLRALDAFRRAPADDANGHRFDEQLIGAMVEGTFMNRAYRGCHNGAFVLDVDDATWRPQLASLAATGSVYAVNVAPETNPAACLDMIREIRNVHGCVPAVGHCRPTGDQLRAAVGAGVEYVIHLGNGHTGSSYKKFNSMGMLEECLRNDRLHVTIIGDGYHVSKRYVRDWVARKELQRVSFVSDRAFALDLPERDFEVFGVRGRRDVLANGRSLLRTVNPADPPNAPVTLFGSACSMMENLENCVRWFSREVEGVTVRRHGAYSLEAALSIAVTLCCANPARLARLDDRLGRIAPGMVGNAVLVRLVQGRVQIVRVFVGHS